MEITTKQQLRFCIKADYLMNRGPWITSRLGTFKQKLKADPIISYLRLMRKTNYYSHSRSWWGGLYLSSISFVTKGLA
jgi:hypothetical protein